MGRMVKRVLTELAGWVVIAVVATVVGWYVPVLWEELMALVR